MKNKKNNAIEAAFQAGRRVPSRSEGAALPCILSFPTDSLHDSPAPPLTSRGVTIPKETEATIIESIEATHEKILGGYDGGVEVGFNGEWSPLKFKTLCQILENDEKDWSNSALQEIAPIWQEVRDLFFEYFPGPVENRKPLDGNADRREVKCTGEALINKRWVVLRVRHRSRKA